MKKHNHITQKITKTPLKNKQNPLRHFIKHFANNTKKTPQNEPIFYGYSLNKQNPLRHFIKHLLYTSKKAKKKAKKANGYS